METDKIIKASDNISGKPYILKRYLGKEKGGGVTYSEIIEDFEGGF